MELGKATLEEAKRQMAGMLDDNWERIQTAFIKHHGDLAVAQKVELKREGEGISVEVFQSFYPQKMFKDNSTKRIVNEKQVELILVPPPNYVHPDLRTRRHTLYMAYFKYDGFNPEWPYENELEVTGEPQCVNSN